MVKGLLDEQTKKKIKILKTSTPEELPSHFNLSQVERKYGGTAPNAEEFWPPTMPGPPFNSAKEPEGHFLSEISSFPDLDENATITPEAQLVKKVSGNLDHRDSLHALLKPMISYFNPNLL